MTEVFIDTDERLDVVVGTNLRLIQKIDGTAFAVDTLLLARFVRLGKEIVRVADLGSGSGILAFLLKYRQPSLEVVGFEVQPEFHDLACRNLQLNPQMTGLSFELLDVREIPARLLPESFDLVVANPPYYPLGTGRLPDRPGRALARHELAGTLKDFVEAAAWLLNYGSRLAMIIPTGRFYELHDYLKAAQFGLRRVQFVHPKEGQPSHLALVEAERFYRGPHEALPALTIHRADGSLGTPFHHPDFLLRS
ncbi:MAG: tRNA (adenine37-N(6))-methyltransferase TrmN6 [Candidatus Ozemobacter sibiricus]|jgi:tRNA1Val (adenine37-N6)-methyltransferase|uniref:tRNA (Adenine37-N(6))-methyltransferase TrmN6 n=1 Tax=Candidatus Ozemobacter sibiricus TaxID=2268124 RepID=A0A367ZNS3_9BACT|nr:MAG: tRNA (adenine37-N(6))-methyltransferase TrmN6 [Candidatus Ozemobacter sibiricus]